MQKFCFFFKKMYECDGPYVGKFLEARHAFLILWATHIIVRIFLHNIGIHLSRCATMGIFFIFVEFIWMTHLK
jgi:hypothetical protein